MFTSSRVSFRVVEAYSALSSWIIMIILAFYSRTMAIVYMMLYAFVICHYSIIIIIIVLYIALL